MILRQTNDVAVEVICGANEEFVEIMVNKSSASETIVGGSNAAGGALPAFHIFPGGSTGSYDQQWIHGFPSSNVKERPCHRQWVQSEVHAQ